MSNNDEVRTTILLHAEDWAILGQYCKDYGLSTSGAIRVIIREWAQFKRSTLIDASPAYITEQA